MITEHRFMLPWPPSMNTYWRKWNNRMVLSPKGRAYRGEVATAPDVIKWLGRFEIMDARLKMLIWIHPPDRRKRDLDNLPKGIQDSLQKAGVYVDDCQIDDLHLIRKKIIKGGMALVFVTELIADKAEEAAQDR